MDAKSRIETDIRGMVFPDGSSVKTIATFKDGKNMEIIMYVVKRNRVITNKVNYTSWHQ